MKYRFFAIAVSEPDAGAAELNAFLGAHRIAGVDKQLVMEDGRGVWSFCVSYLDGDAPTPARGRGRIDYREILSAEDFAVYAQLRNLRKELAERDGVPAYSVLTNEQLAAVVQRAVVDATGLAGIDGVGQARIEKYGEPLLVLHRKLLTERAAGGAGTAEAPASQA